MALLVEVCHWVGFEVSNTSERFSVNLFSCCLLTKMQNSLLLLQNHVCLNATMPDNDDNRLNL